MTIIRIGLDTAKSVFQVHAVDESGRPVERRKLRRGEVAAYFAGLRPTRVGLEACGAAHHWARVLRGLGHQPVLLPPQYVKPYVKRGKSDAADAEAICEAMSRPGMRFVAVKSIEQQAALTLVKTRELLVKQRTMVTNAMRGHAAEFGVVAAKGKDKIGEIVRRADDPAAAVPEAVRRSLAVLAGQATALDAEVAALNRELAAWHQADPMSQCLATQPGVGPLAATNFVLKVADPTGFRSGRHFAAWLGLTPKEHSSGGKRSPGKISREGDEGLRKLLVLGATAVIRAAAIRPERATPWLLQLLARKPRKLAAVALANKMARTLWAMMVTGEVYRRPTPA